MLAAGRTAIREAIADGELRRRKCGAPSPLVADSKRDDAIHAVLGGEDALGCIKIAPGPQHEGDLGCELILAEVA